MTSWERFKRMYEHREADRIPITDNPWQGTLKRWHAEGMPKDVDWRDFFSVDKVAPISIDISPRFEEKILEQTDRYVIKTTAYGATMREFRELDSTPEVLDFKVKTPEDWPEVKARMTREDDRIPWKLLQDNYDRWRAEGQWIRACFWFGFDVTHSRLVGTERFLLMMMDHPEIAEDIFDTYLTSCETLFDRIWDAGYHFDEIFWWDDMGYKGTAFFSPKVYRRLLQKYHKRAVDWAHNKGIYAQLHSCGNIMKMMPEVIDTGIDALNPLEVKAGMDPFFMKKEYGHKLVLHGGINALYWQDLDQVLPEIERLVPMLKENGGYIFASDHSIPNDVSLENMRAIVAAAKKFGSY